MERGRNDNQLEINREPLHSPSPQAKAPQFNMRLDEEEGLFLFQVWRVTKLQMILKGIVFNCSNLTTGQK